MVSLRRAALRLWAHRDTAIAFLLLFTFFRMARLEGWDDGFYLSELTSAVGDRDLLLQDDLLRIENPLPLRLRALTVILDSGALQNTFSVGPPAVHAAYTWPLLVGRAHPCLFPLRVLLALGSMALLALLVIVSSRIAQRLGVPPALAPGGAVLAIVAGPLALYGTRSYLGSHLLSAVWAAVLLAAALRWLEEGHLRQAAAMGLAAGFLVITRWQDAVLAAGLAPSLLVALRDPAARRRRLIGLALAAAAGAAAVSLQLLAWRAQFGAWTLMPQGPAYVSWTRPHLAFFVSTYHGLLPWAPGLVIGLLAFAWAQPRLPRPTALAGKVGVLAGAAAVVYVSACVADWYGGDSYGPRRLSVLTPMVAVGLGHLLARLPRPARLAVAAAIVAWTVFTLTAFLSGYDDLRVALGGRPDPASPVSAASYEGARWLDAPRSWPKVLRPGFTFSDRPRNFDRAIGAIATLAVLLLVRAAAAAARTARGQRVMVGLLAGWVAVAVAWTVRLPSNARADAAWRDVVAGADPEPRLEALPESVRPAAWTIHAVHAAARGNVPEERRALAHVDAVTAPGVDEAALAAWLHDADARAFVADLAAGRRVVLP
jgi:hypothetical protein